MNEIKIYRSRLKSTMYMLGCLVFVAGSILFILNGTREFYPWFTALLFAYLFFQYGLREFLDRRPKIVFNETGIFARDMHTEIINWSLVKDAYLVKMYGEKYISLVLDENLRPSIGDDKKQKVLAKYFEYQGAQEFNIPLRGVKVDAQNLLSFILAMIKAPQAQRKELIMLEAGKLK